MRKTLSKAVALSVCLGLLLMAVPNVNAVEKKAPKFNFLKKPMMIINSFVPIFASIFDSGKKSPDQTTTVKKVKTAGTLPSHILSDGD